MGRKVAIPLDFGGVTEVYPEFSGIDTAPPVAPIADARPKPAHIGAQLRAARELQGLDLQDLADVTRIRRSYLAAIEEMRLEQLPSRPFIVGYVRAYAQALRLDGEAAVARFKSDAPELAEPLRAPIGVTRERDPRLYLIAAAAAAVISAVLVWNLAQHAMIKDAPAAPVVPDAPAAQPARPAAGQTAVVLTAAQPAPQESTAPAPYVTPGLVPVDPANPAPAPPKPGAAVAMPVIADAAAGAISPARAAFNPKGSVYGAAAHESEVTLQARKTASLIIRGSDGTVYFARQLAAGEAYRAPMLKGLTVDVSDPAAFDVYTKGELRGALQTAQTALGRLSG